MAIPQKPGVFWPVFLGVLVLDIVTKHLAVQHLLLHTPLPVLGGVLRLTLSHNQGAALGIHLGGASRMVFSILAIVVSAVLVVVYRRLPVDAGRRALPIALLMGGAIGNLLDRLRSSQGVVDFIDVGIGTHRFYTFNVADAALTCGVILLLLGTREEGEGEATSE